MSGDNSGRPDTSLIDPEVRDEWVGSIQAALSLDADEYQIAGVLRCMDTDLNKSPEMYTAVLDHMVELKIITKAQWRAYLQVEMPRDNR